MAVREPRAAPVPPSDVAANSLATSAWANAVADAIQQLIADLYPAGVLAIGWAAVTGKPTAFAPSVHAHTDAASGGTIAYGSLTGKPSSMAPTAHAHADAGSGGTVPYANLTGKPTSMAPTAHTHANASTGGVIPYANLSGEPTSAADLGGWVNPSSSTGTRIYVQTASPGNPVDGDVWIKG